MATLSRAGGRERGLIAAAGLLFAAASIVTLNQKPRKITQRMGKVTVLLRRAALSEPV